MRTFYKIVKISPYIICPSFVSSFVFYTFWPLCKAFKCPTVFLTALRWLKKSPKMSHDNFARQKYFLECL